MNTSSEYVAERLAIMNNSSDYVAERLALMNKIASHRLGFFFYIRYIAWAGTIYVYKNMIKRIPPRHIPYILHNMRQIYNIVSAMPILRPIAHGMRNWVRKCRKIYS